MDSRRFELTAEVPGCKISDGEGSVVSPCSGSVAVLDVIFCSAHLVGFVDFARAGTQVDVDAYVQA